MYYCLRRSGLDAEPASPESYYIIYNIIILITTYPQSSSNGARKTLQRRSDLCGR